MVKILESTTQTGHEILLQSDFPRFVGDGWLPSGYATPPCDRGGSSPHLSRTGEPSGVDAVLENCRKALELLENSAGEPSDEDVAKDAPLATARGEEGSPLRSDTDADKLCTLLKSRVELSYFLEKLWSMQTSVHQNIHDDNASWDMVTARDLWEDRLVNGENDSEQDGFVLVRQEDIVDGIACFMADYILSLQQMKEFTPNQLQDALCKTFSVKKRSQLRKAWDGSKVIYNVASWSATAIEMYQNAAIFKAAASLARIISKLF